MLNVTFTTASTSFSREDVSSVPPPLTSFELRGVARKTANVVAAELGEAQGIVVDTHVRRISQRLGLTREDDPVKIERDLVKIVPQADWHRFPHLLIWHGRRVCDARTPSGAVKRVVGMTSTVPIKET